MYEFQVIEIHDTLWNDYIKSANVYDFYHTSCYHKIEQTKDDTPVLLVAKFNGEFICLPLIIKQINGLDLFDATSVYGYCGPVASKPFEELKSELIDFFKTNFRDYCNSKKIISVFSRLHPLVNTDNFFEGFGVVKKLNKVITIDLTKDIDIQRQHYSRSYKNQINKLKKKKGYYVTKLNKKDISIFQDIYYETMKRLNAKDYYYFSEEYLRSLVDNNCFESEVLIAYNNLNIPASAAIFTVTKGIMQYHLGGTKNFALNDSPIKYVIDEARLLANKKKLKYFNLGGGLDGSDDDPLFKFKSGFCKSFHYFDVWNLVINQNEYDKITLEKGINPVNYPNFFPLYRAINS